MIIEAIQLGIEQYWFLNPYRNYILVQEEGANSIEILDMHDV